MRVAMLGLLLAAMAARAYQCAAVIDDRMGEVDVSALAIADGAALRSVEIEVDGDRTWRRSPLKLSYGKHRLRISASGFRGVERDIDLRQSRMSIRVALEFSLMHMDECGDRAGSMGGQISGGEGELWVKAVPVVGVGGTEARVDSSGFFLLESLQAADHLLLVMRGSTVLHQQLVRPSPKQTNVRIDLKPAR